MFFDNGHMVGMHGWWWLFWLVLIAAALFTAWGGWGRGGRDSRGRRESPREVLQRRLASGDITAQEYEACKRLLDRDDPGRS